MTKINGIVYSDDMRTIEKCDIDLSGSIVIPEGVEFIKEKAFARTDITSVKLPSSLKYIGERAFAYCKHLEYVDFGDNKNDVLSGNEIFYYSAIKNIEIPGSIKTIGYDCFQKCPIESVTFEEGVELINIPHISGSACFIGFNNIQTMLEDYMKGKRDNISYIDMINNVPFPSLKFIQAAEIYDKTHDSLVLHFLKENNTEVKNYLLESENVILLSKLISSNVFSKKQLVDILHNEICNSSIPLKAIVLDKLKKQSFESSKFNI